jgi:hypothetical protein
LDSDTTNRSGLVFALPSEISAPRTETVGREPPESSSTISAWPVDAAVPLAISGLGVTTRLKVSLASTLVSPMTGTLTVAVVCPGAKVSVPLVAV